jgi:3-hydroxy-9,10-secoandrosta-1,3,5(10)-triene-9,17-dione monooxygenase reductase component
MFVGDVEIDRSVFKTVVGHFPTGVAIITGKGRDGPVGLTIQSFMSLSLDPPLVLASIARRSVSWPLIAASKSGFAINILSESQRDLAFAFARSGGPKFEGVRWRSGEFTAAPILDGVQAWLECGVRATHDGGDHEIIVASVLNVNVSASDASLPLIFMRSQFSKVDAEHWNSLSVA